MFLLFVLVTLAISYYAWQRLQSLDQPLAISDTTCIALNSGESLSHFANKLNRQNIEVDTLAWRAWAKYKALTTQVKAGEYCISEGETPKSLLNRLVKGDVRQYKFTIIPGWNTRQLLQQLANNDKLQQTIKDNTSATQLAELMSLPNGHAEGWFAPNTYFFTSGSKDVDILNQAYKAQQNNLENAWKNRQDNLPYDSAFEVLTMASIIEKETGVAYERPEIAGVFVRRLNKGMKLQTDPTVIYGMGEAYNGNITRRDLNTVTPYNTYQIYGMPPTPIAMPSKAAIEAAVNPAEGRSLFFVAKGDGSHYFSNTYKEHQKAVRQYQLNRAADYRSSVQ